MRSIMVHCCLVHDGWLGVEMRGIFSGLNRSFLRTKSSTDAILRGTQSTVFQSFHRTQRTRLNLLIFQERQDRSKIESIREECRQEEWICEDCSEPVTVRAGEIYRWHFAHQRKSDCPRQNESHQLLTLRAALFGWLERKFPGRVEIEYRVKDGNLARPIDCWIRESDSGPSWPIAYWIHEKGIRGAHDQVALADQLRRLTPNVNFVFDHRRLPNGESSESAVPKWFGEGKRYSLSPTERGMIQATAYDQIYAEQSEGSLHYLEPKGEGRLTTLRAIRALHGTQVFGAVPIDSALPELQIHPKTGEPVHCGEYERLQEYRAAAKGRPQPPTVATVPGTGRPSKGGAGSCERDLTPPMILTAVFRCRVCGVEVGARDAQVMNCGNKTCTCNRCYGQRG